ncbi:MAG: hypothetical protein HZA65_03620 [Rhodocyclales bacterium]|nr:hypothetical protein [Rhodocyclales bacterium]
MAKIPYGFEANSYFSDDALQQGTTEDAAWAMLAEVQKRLEEGKPLPCELASWLGRAIERSLPTRSSSEFLQELGLKKRRGEKGPFNRHFKLYWSMRLYEIATNDEELAPEQVILAVRDEMAAAGIDEDRQPSRATLQEWLSEMMDAIRQEEDDL